MVYEGPSAYSDMARLNVNRMGLLYEKGSISPYETITFARFDEDWLDEPPPPAEAPGAAFWNLEESSAGGVAPTDPGAILDVHPDGLNLHMTATRAFPVVAGAPAYGDGGAIAFAADGGLRIFDVDSGNRFDYGPSHSFTIEVVCRMPSGSTQIGALVAKDLAAKSPSWWLRVESGKARFLISDNTLECVFSSSATINDGQWHHIAAVRDVTDPGARQLRLYVDGVLSGSLPDTTVNSLANGQAVWIGRFNSANRLFTGEIDLVRISPVALTPSQFVLKTTQFDADADGIPDPFERAETGGLTELGPDHLGGFGFGASPATASLPPSRIVTEDGSVVIRQAQRDLPFWLEIQLLRSLDLVKWEPIASETSDEPLEGDIILRADRIPVSDEHPVEFFRYELVTTP